MSYDLFDVIRNKVPLLTFFIQMMIVNIFYRECASEEQKIGFWIYFPILCLACLLWELGYTIRFFSHTYSHKSLKSRICFGIFSSFISVCTFCTASYYVEAGKPFSCIYPYNKTVAPILFYVTISIVILLSMYEHYKWGVIKSLLPFTVHDSQSISANNLGNFTEIQRVSDFGHRSQSFSQYGSPSAEYLLNQ